MIVQPRVVYGIYLLAPLFLLFELWQLVMGERYLGIKQIARGADPRKMGPSELVSFFWVSSIVAYIAWTMALLMSPGSRGPAVGIVATTVVGYSIRRNCGLKFVLVVLTFEGAFRIIFVGALTYAAWRHI